MRISRRYMPGKGVIEERVQGEEMRPRRTRQGRQGRKGDVVFDLERNRIEARGLDGKVRGLELPKGD